MNRKPEDPVSLRDEKNLIGYKIIHSMVRGTRPGGKVSEDPCPTANFIWCIKSHFFLHKKSPKTYLSRFARGTFGIVCN